METDGNGPIDTLTHIQVLKVRYTILVEFVYRHSPFTLT